MRRLFLHIDRVVLDGMAHGERLAFERGLRAALASALTAPGAGERWANQPGAARLDAGPVRVAADAGAFDIGERAAQRIVGSATP